MSSRPRRFASAPMARKNSPDMTSPQHPEMWAATVQCLDHHVPTVCVAARAEGGYNKVTWEWDLMQTHQDAERAAQYVSWSPQRCYGGDCRRKVG